MKNSLCIMFTVPFIIISLSALSQKQSPATTDFYDLIKNYDLSSIWTTDSILTEDNEDGKDKIKKSEPLGFIGDDYQRFYIHFISVTKSQKYSYDYTVSGKTKVKNIICDFYGTIKVIESKLYVYGDLQKFKQGYAICDVEFYGDNEQISCGTITGKLTTNFIIDDKNRFRYDALMFFGDEFSNNQFEGILTNYGIKETKKCNWGDYRIPDSEKLDTGAGEFMVDEKYIKNGWENFVLSNSDDQNKLEVKDAIKKELEQWWK